MELGLVAKGARAVGRGVEGAAADGVVDDAALAAAEDIGADDDGGRDGEEEDEGRWRHGVRTAHGQRKRRRSPRKVYTGAIGR